MKRKVFAAVALSVVLAAPAFADWRVDVGADVPWGIGAVLSGFGGSTSAGINVLENYLFLVPEVGFHYQFAAGPVRLGLGLRAFSLVLESLAWPNAFAEVNLGPIAVDLNVGGGAFLAFGLFNDLTTGSLIIPDLSAYLKLGKVFRVGVGAMYFYFPSQSWSGNAFPYVIYLSGKFSFRF